MTENSNTPPEANAGPPPGEASGQPASPQAAPIPPTAAQPAAAQPAAQPVADQPVAPQPAATSASPSPAVPGTTAATGATEATAAAAAPVTATAAADRAPSGAQPGVQAEPWGPPPEDDAEFGGPLDPAAPNTGIAATFLPGIEAASVLALLTALLAAGAYLLVYPLVQAHGAARTWSDFKNNVPRARQDPFGTERDWIQYQSWTHIILGLLAILLALLVLGLWTAQRNRLHSRAFAQAALVLGLAVVLYGILLKTGVVGSEIPSMKEIGGALSSQQ